MPAVERLLCGELIQIDELTENDLTLNSKCGCDGGSRQSEYEQRFNTKLPTLFTNGY